MYLRRDFQEKIKKDSIVSYIPSHFHPFSAYFSNRRWSIPPRSSRIRALLQETRGARLTIMKRDVFKGASPPPPSSILFWSPCGEQ